MKVILKEQVSNLGEIGDVVTVKNGYARNYLFPQSKALGQRKATWKKLKQEKQNCCRNKLKSARLYLREPIKFLERKLRFLRKLRMEEVNYLVQFPQLPSLNFD